LAPTGRNLGRDVAASASEPIFDLGSTRWRSRPQISGCFLGGRGSRRAETCFEEAARRESRPPLHMEIFMTLCMEGRRDLSEADIRLMSIAAGRECVRSGWINSRLRLSGLTRRGAVLPVRQAHPFDGFDRLTASRLRMTLSGVEWVRAPRHLSRGCVLSPRARPAFAPPSPKASDGHSNATARQARSRPYDEGIRVVAAENESALCARGRAHDAAWTQAALYAPIVSIDLLRSLFLLIAATVLGPRWMMMIQTESNEAR